MYLESKPRWIRWIERTPFATAATSSSSKNITRFVCSITALASLAKKYSAYSNGNSKYHIYTKLLLSQLGLFHPVLLSFILSNNTLSLGLHIDIDSPSGAAIRNSAEVLLDCCGVAAPEAPKWCFFPSRSLLKYKKTISKFSVIRIKTRFENNCTKYSVMSSNKTLLLTCTV